MEPDQKVINEFVVNGQFKELVKFIQQNYPKQIRNYQFITINKNNIGIDQSIIFKDQSDQIFSAKIKKIYNVLDFNNKFIPFIKVYCYYQKNDITIPESCSNYISDRELFLTDLKEYIQVNQIIKQITVLPMRQYLSINKPSQDVYFTRAGIRDSSLEPPFYRWEKVCICQFPMNLNVQKCQRCEKYYHKNCILFNEQNICEKCQ